jgi:hypothetical protein
MRQLLRCEVLVEPGLKEKEINLQYVFLNYRHNNKLSSSHRVLVSGMCRFIEI